jgi:hypothetical protein
MLKRVLASHLKGRKKSMDRIEKLKNDIYSFAELDTMEKNATQLADMETLDLIERSRASKAAKGEKPKKVDDADETARSKRDRNRRS